MESKKNKLEKTAENEAQKVVMDRTPEGYMRDTLTGMVLPTQSPEIGKQILEEAKAMSSYNEKASIEFREKQSMQSGQSYVGKGDSFWAY